MADALKKPNLFDIVPLVHDAFMFDHWATKGVEMDAALGAYHREQAALLVEGICTCEVGWPCKCPYIAAAIRHMKDTSLPRPTPKPAPRPREVPPIVINVLAPDPALCYDSVVRAVVSLRRRHRWH